MVRPLRIEYENAVYHVTCRGNGGASIFRDDRDRRRFLKSLSQSLKLFCVELHCYVLMLTHFHFLLKTPEGNLSRFMQRFNTAYTAYFNLRHHRNGHLYQGRFKAILVEADEYMMELSRYIHLNPIRVKKYQDAPVGEKLKVLRRYRWSSFPGYINTRRREGFVKYRDVLSYLGGDNKKGRAAYRSFVLSGLEKRLLNPLEEAKAGLILGSEDFLSRVQEKYMESGEPLSRDYGGLDSIKKGIPVSRIAGEVAREYGVRADDILRKRSVYREARQVLMELCYQLNTKKMSARELGKDLGGVSGEAVFKIHRKMQERLREDRAVRSAIERIIYRLQS